MIGFRILLIAIFSALLVYTGIVIANHGWNLLAVFFGDMAKLGWPGQFNLDFMFMLALSGLWVAWRHGFSGLGLLLGLLAFIGGALFQSVYLLAISLQAKGNMREIVLGKSRVQG